MSSKQYVVWEWKNKQRRWRPYSPEVSQLLERAYQKKLKFVNLGDGDPNCSQYSIDMNSMQLMMRDTNEIISSVRRKLYSGDSPAAKGAQWQWSGDNLKDWIGYDMEVQCVLEECWAMGFSKIDLSDHIIGCPYLIDYSNSTQTNKQTNRARKIRRVPIATYPVCLRVPTNNLNNIGILPTSTIKPQKINENTTENKSGKKRSSKNDDLDGKKHESLGARSLLSKVMNLASSSCTGGGSNNQSCSSPLPPHPQPLPRSVAMPPTPLPRTKPMPLMVNHQHQNFSPPPPSVGHGFGSAHPSQNGHARPPAPSLSHRSSMEFSPPQSPTLLQALHFKHQDHLQKYSNYALRSQNEQRYRHFRNESLDGKFDSTTTLNSDSGYSNGRRPSLDTVSTYLSQEDEAYMDHQSYLHSSRDSTSKSYMESTEDYDLDDDTFFDADDEVQQTLKGYIPPDEQNPFTLQNFNEPPSNIPAASPNSHFIPIGRNGSIRRTDSISYANRPIRRKPAKTTEEKLLHKHTRVMRKISSEDCSICMSNLTEKPGFDNNDMMGYDDDLVVALTLCNHQFHEQCLMELVKSSSDYIECPNCKTFHGLKIGNQPDGRMDIRETHHSLPGHSDCNTIEITYTIYPGIQGPKHPHPGQRYVLNGFPRVAYLPNNQKGKRVLKLLKEAFDRKLIFTVGRSVTSGIDDAVTWNEIHHKTDYHNGNGHGYPDPDYLDRVLIELAEQGVTECTDV